MRYLIFIIGLALTGCASLIPPPLAGDAQSAASMEIAAEEGWKSVLQNSVDSQGRINFREINVFNAI